MPLTNPQKNVIKDDSRFSAYCEIHEFFDYNVYSMGDLGVSHSLLQKAEISLIPSWFKD